MNNQNYSRPFGQNNNYRNNNNQGGGGYRPSGGYQNNQGGGYQNSGGNNYQSNNNQEEREARQLPEPFFYMPYAVVGNRDTPAPIMDRAKLLAKKLSEKGFTARVGGLDGLDRAIMEVAGQGVELQLPWKNFGGLESKTSYSAPEILAIAKHFTQGWDALKLPVQGFLGKNVRVLLGEKARSLAMFLLVHSDDGAENAQEVTAKTGAAGHAIKVACHYNIPVFNLQKPDCEQHVYQMFHLVKDSTKPLIEDEAAEY